MQATSVPHRVLATLLVSCLAITWTICGFATGTARATSQSVATAAGELSVNETARLHLVTHHPSILNEEGSGSGTFSCPLTVTVKVSYTTATVSYSICRAGGSFSGTGETQFYASGETAHFEGTVNIAHGTGRYARASTYGLKIRGSFRRSNYALSLSVTGKMHV